MIGDAKKAREVLGWTPTVGFKELIHMMVDADLDLAAREHHSLSAPTAANDPKLKSPFPRVA